MMISPERQLEYLDIRPGHTVLECGVGSGKYAMAVARRVGESGYVHIADIQKPLLEKFLHDLQVNNMSHAQTHWTDLDQEHSLRDFAESSCDRVLIANMLWMLEQPRLLVKEVFRVLKPGGKVLIIDWSESHGGIGPHADHVVHVDIARMYVDEVDFSLVKEGLDVGQYHYGLLAIK
jgi:demethylmenaquinone methyltransferase/2-methoxy-6-polyprenyl-1,4-benzoquinol methylase